MVPGTVLFDKDFRFHDGQRGEKLFVVLSDGRNGTYITVKTTSNDSRFGVIYGCQITARFPHFFLPKGSCFLERHTWLCLDEFYEFDARTLISRITMGQIHRIGVMTATLTREVQSCAINCFDILEEQADVLRELWSETKSSESSQ